MAIGYVGTYTTGKSNGIYYFNFDPPTGHFTECRLFCNIKDPKYITYDYNTLFSIFSNKEGSGVVAINEQGDIIDCITFEKSTSCFLMFHKHCIYTANYHEGTISKLSYQNKKFTFQKKTLIKDKAGCHQVIVHGNHLLLPALLIDKVYVLTMDLEILDVLELPKGFGPRHGIVSSDNKKFYLLGELSNQLCVYLFHKGKYVVQSITSILPEQKIHQTGSAAIRMSKDETTLIISTRISNTITIVDISTDMPNTIHFFDSNGHHPRDLLNILNDRYLLVANRESNSIISYSINKDFSLTKICTLEIPEGVSICMKGDINL